jgi:O-antigen/teichoic acid export membrane protein
MTELVLTSPLTRALKNFGVLMGGRAVAGVVSLVALTLVARILGPIDFGMLVLVHTTALVVRGLLNFKPSDVVVRFGVESFDDNDQKRLSALLKITLGRDLTSSVAATLIAIVVMGVVAPAVGLPQELNLPAMLYALTLLVSGKGSATGILRLADRFDAIGFQQTVGPAVRLTGIGIVYGLNGTLTGYLTVWAIALMSEYLFMNVLGWREFKKQHLMLSLPSLRGAESQFPGVWSFVRTLYWQSNLDLAQRHGLTLLAGVFLGAASAGTFRIAREFADVLAKPVVVIRQAIFPDLARLWRARDPHFKVLYLRLGLVAGCVAVVVVVLTGTYGEELLTLLLGDEYIHGAVLLTWLMCGAAVDLIGAGLRPAAYAMGAAKAALRVQFVVVGCHVLTFILFVSLFKLTGAGIAATLSSLLMMFGMLWLVATYAKRSPEVVGERPQ